MRNIDMQTICFRCNKYQLITYADGSSGVGCCHDDMLPIDIRNLESCPMGKDAHILVRFNKVELLKVLGGIYAEISVSPKIISLTKCFEDVHISFRGKKHLLPSAIIQLGIVKIVEKKGLRHVYKWDASCPSLEMAEQICDRMVELQRAHLVRKANEKKEKCKGCRFAGVTGCREVIRRLGLDCYKYDLSKAMLVI